MKHKSTDKLPKGLRKFVPTDAPSIFKILNETALTGQNSPFVKPLSVKELASMLAHWVQNNDPIYVIERQGQVVGWLSITPFSWWGRQACSITGEVAVYISQSHISKGLGYRLSQAAILIAKQHGYKNIVTWILEKNSASKALSKAFGGDLWGVFPKIACFGNVQSDVHLLGMSLEDK